MNPEIRINGRLTDSSWTAKRSGYNVVRLRNWRTLVPRDNRKVAHLRCPYEILSAVVTIMMIMVRQVITFSVIIVEAVEDNIILYSMIMLSSPHLCDDNTSHYHVPVRNTPRVSHNNPSYYHVPCLPAISGCCIFLLSVSHSGLQLNVKR